MDSIKYCLDVILESIEGKTDDQSSNMKEWLVPLKKWKPLSTDSDQESYLMKYQTKFIDISKEYGD